jgi:hypothetical protein
MREIRRVLRPGGVACVATELILDGGPHPEYFTWDDLEYWVIRPSGMVLVEEPSRALPPQRYLDDPVRLPEEYLRTPHVVLATGSWRFTSVCLFFAKPRTRDLARGLALRLNNTLRRR